MLRFHLVFKAEDGLKFVDRILKGLPYDNMSDEMGTDFAVVGIWNPKNYSETELEEKHELAMTKKVTPVVSDVKRAGT